MADLTDEEIAKLRNWVERGLVGPGEAVPRLLDERERARALLRRLEWRGHNGACPECGGKPGDGPVAPNGHFSGIDGTYRCELAALIGK